MALRHSCEIRETVESGRDKIIYSRDDLSAARLALTAQQYVRFREKGILIWANECYKLYLWLNIFT